MPHTKLSISEFDSIVNEETRRRELILDYFSPCRFTVYEPNLSTPIAKILLVLKQEKIQ